MRRSAFAIIAMFVMFAACDGRGGWSDPLTNELLDYPEIKVVDFNVAGTIVCPRCSDGEIDVVGARVEVQPLDDPLHDALAVRMLDGIGPFAISNLRYRAGVKLRILCHIYTSTEPDNIGMTRDVESSVPNNDDETIAVTINF